MQKLGKQQNLQGVKVKISAPEYMGKEGIYLQEGVDKGQAVIQVQLADQKVWVPRMYVKIVGESAVIENVTETQFGGYKASQFVQEEIKNIDNYGWDAE